MGKLTDAEIAKALAGLEGWTVRQGKLHREYGFPDFAHAIGFVMIAAPAIERLNHHPEWSNVYNRVTVDLTTHDAGGITQMDCDLAALLEGIAQKLQE
jgi:4a-hydroxytetrahydrobiopterin dehydratase